MEEYLLKFTPPNRVPSSCDITIYRAIQLVVVGETSEGMSRSAGAVTNAAEIIATELVRQQNLDPQRMLYIEHYPEAQRPQPYGESYDLVTFTWDGNQARNPEWRHLTVDEFNEILDTVAD